MPIFGGMAVIFPLSRGNRVRLEYVVSARWMCGEIYFGVCRVNWWGNW